jgi:cell division control protein 24
MQNVTETISISKPGSYTCQIFWKGDPGIENFIIRFATEEQMKKWAGQVDAQRRDAVDRSRTSASSRPSKPEYVEFTAMQGLGQNLTNPYIEDEEDEDENNDGDISNANQPEYAMSRNGSNPSLRSRSTTGDSGPPMGSYDPRVPPPRFPMNPNAQPLTLRTQQLQNQNPNPDSYFSPVAESPISSRTSSSSTGMFPFPRQGTPGYGGHEDHHRFTAPAPGRNIRPDGQNGFPRNPMQRPSLPPPGSQQAAMAQQRLRSASSPDIQNANNARKPSNGQIPDLPPFPTHYAYTPGLVNRSLNSSPSNPMIPPARSATQSPHVQRERLLQRTATEYDYPGAAPAPLDPRAHPPTSVPRAITPASSVRTMTPASMESRTMSPPMPSASSMDLPIPSQLKVKVHCPSAQTMMTLVVSTNISYQSLKDRIEAKLQRSTNVSLSSGQVKLKFLDDDDYVSIQSDEDVQTAFETWKEQHQQEQLMAGQLGEIELYCM